MTRAKGDYVKVLEKIDGISAKIVYDDTIARIVETISQSPRIHQRGIATKAKVSRGLCSYHLKNLANGGIVKIVDTGYKKFYVLSEDGRRALELRRSIFPGH